MHSYYAGITEDDEGEDNENDEENSVDYSLKKSLGVIGRGFTNTTKKLSFRKRTKRCMCINLNIYSTHAVILSHCMYREQCIVYVSYCTD